MIFAFWVGLSFALSWMILRMLARSPLAKYFGDAPDHRKVHQSVVPRLGGLAMCLAFLAALGLQALAPGPLSLPHAGFFTATSIFIGFFLIFAGGWDDVRPLNFKMKFLLQFILAAVAVLILGNRFESVALLGHHVDLGVAGALFSMFWIVAVMNALNIIDGIDGLAGGAALCGIAAVAFLAGSQGADDLLPTCLCLAGVILGFLRFNFSRRNKVFLGDTGSQFLGAMLAVLAMRVHDLPGIQSSFVVALGIVGYPLLDISVAMGRRFMKKRGRGLGSRVTGMFAADNEHLHHRLVYLGHTHGQSTLLLLMVAGSLGASTVILSQVEWPYRVGLIAYLTLALFAILNRLGYVGLKPWISIPRVKPPAAKIVGVIETDDVFFHSLKTFPQDEFQFLSVPAKLAGFLSEDLDAVILYSTSSQNFAEEWPVALRISQNQECRAVVVADAADIDTVRREDPPHARAVHFVEKPVRVPDLIRELRHLSAGKRRTRSEEPRFSLAELAMRNAPQESAVP